MSRSVKDGVYREKNSTCTGSYFLDLRSNIFTVLSMDPESTSVDSSLNFTQLTVPKKQILRLGKINFSFTQGNSMPISTLIQQEGLWALGRLPEEKGQRSQWSHLQRTTNVVHQILVEDL